MFNTRRDQIQQIFQKLVIYSLQYGWGRRALTRHENCLSARPVLDSIPPLGGSNRRRPHLRKHPTLSTLNPPHFRTRPEHTNQPHQRHTITPKMSTSITPPPPPAGFRKGPNAQSIQKPDSPPNLSPRLPETAPTPELTFASILNLSSANLWEVKAPPLDLPLYLSSTPTHSESNHGSPVVSPFAASTS
jgi:hypothetical protein